MYNVTRVEPIFVGSEIKKTEVMIVQLKPFVQMLYQLDGNYLESNEEELVKLVLEAYYQDTFKERAEAEKFKDINEALKEANEQRKQAIERLDESTKATSLQTIKLQEHDYILNIILEKLNINLEEVEEDEESTNEPITDNKTDKEGNRDE